MVNKQAEGKYLSSKLNCEVHLCLIYTLMQWIQYF